MNFFQNKKNSGQALAEYMILVLLIGMISLAAARSFGLSMKRKFHSLKKEITSQDVNNDGS